MLFPRQDTQAMPPDMQNLPTDDKGPLIIGMTVMFEVFACIAMAMRFWSLSIRRQKMAIHDILIVIGFVVATALAICLIVSVEEGGLGAQAWTLADEPWKLITFGKLLIAIQLLWAVSMTAIRCSILFLYTHIFSSSRTFRFACYGMMGVCVLWAIGDILTVGLLCRPIAFNWDKTVPGGSCGNINAAYLAVHSFNFIIDAGISVMPIPVLWGLQMPRANKVGISIMFALGALICAISIARIALFQLALAYDQTNFTYDGSTLYLFTVMEPLVACSLACIPMLRPVTERLATSSIVSWTKSLVGGTSSSKSKNVTGGSSSSTSNSSRRHMAPKAGDHGYVETHSTEGLHQPSMPVTTAAATTHARASPDMEHGRPSSAERGIHVDYHIEQSDVEMQNVARGEKGDWNHGW